MYITVFLETVVKSAMFQNVVLCRVVGGFQLSQELSASVFRIEEYATEGKMVRIEESQEWSQG
jgi:hypothetical protein